MDFGIVAPALLKGALFTLIIFTGAAVLGIVVSLVMGLARLSAWRVVSWPAQAYIEVFRGTSAFVQLFWFYYALPQFGLQLPALLAAVLAVGLNTSAYGAEIVRASIGAVDKGQREAAMALGLTSAQRMRHVILPQAIPTMIPPFGNLLIEALKNSALATAVSVHELTWQTQQLGQTTYPNHRLALFLIALAIYFVLSLKITALTRWLERLTGRHLGSAGAAHG